MADEKRIYIKPNLTIHGKLKDETAGSTASGFESNSKDFP